MKPCRPKRPVPTRTSAKAVNSNETEDQMGKNASDLCVQLHLLEDVVQVMMQPGELNWVLCRASHSSCTPGGVWRDQALNRKAKPTVPFSESLSMSAPALLMCSPGKYILSGGLGCPDFIMK